MVPAGVLAAMGPTVTAILIAAISGLHLQDGPQLLRPLQKARTPLPYTALGSPAGEVLVIMTVSPVRLTRVSSLLFANFT